MTGHPGSDRARRVGIALLGWYPRPWRMRYEHEMRALLEDMPVSWAQVGNLAGTAIREWFSPRAFGSPRTASGRLILIRTLSFMACAYALDAVARLAAAKYAPGRVELPEWVGTGAVLLTFALAVRVLLETMVRLIKRPWATRMRQRGNSWLQLRDREILVWALLAFPAMFVEHAEAIPSWMSPAMVSLKPYLHLLRIFVWTQLALQSSRSTIRLMRINSSALKRRWRSRVTTSYFG